MAIDSNASLSQPPARSDGRDRIAVDAAIFLRFALSRHAEHRIEERSTMTSAEILELLNAGRAVRLNDPFRHLERRALPDLFPTGQQASRGRHSTRDDPARDRYRRHRARTNAV